MVSAVNENTLVLGVPSALLSKYSGQISPFSITKTRTSAFTGIPVSVKENDSFTPSPSLSTSGVLPEVSSLATSSSPTTAITVVPLTVPLIVPVESENT